MTTDTRALVQRLHDALVDWLRFVEGEDDDDTTPSQEREARTIGALDGATEELDRGVRDERARRGSSAAASDLRSSLALQVAYIVRERAEALRPVEDPESFDDWHGAMNDLFVTCEIEVDPIAAWQRPAHWRRAPPDDALAAARQSADAIAHHVAALGDAPWSLGADGVAHQIALAGHARVLDACASDVARPAHALVIRFAARAIRIMNRGRVLPYTADVWREVQGASALLSRALG